MKVVFDTNVYVSALVQPGGRAAQALVRVIEGKDRLYISKPILLEVLDVLARKFDRDKEQLARVSIFLSELAETVEPDRRLRVLDDEPDNRILECAVSGGVDAVITGDRAMLELGEYEGVKILTLRAYLALP